MPTPSQETKAPPKPLVIYSGLGDLQNARLAAHWSKPTVIVAGARAMWDVPAEAEVMMTFMRPWGGAPAQAPPSWPNNLKWVQIGSAGVDIFPRWFFTAPLVTCGRGVQAAAMSEYVMAAVFAHEKQFWDVRARSLADWHPASLGGVAGKTIGLCGFGAIGSEIAPRAMALGMRVVAMTRARRDLPKGIEVVDRIEQLMAVSDHLVLAVPLTERTRHIIDARSLSAAKPGIHIINVARGGLIDDDALLAAIEEKLVAAATIDVTSPEPLPADHIFFTHPTIRLTPHISGMSEDFEDRLTAKLLMNVDRYVRGEKLNDIVEADRGY